MDYMLLIHSEESTDAPTPGTPAFDEMMAAWFEYNQRLIDGGHWIAGASLLPTMTATTLRKTSGAKPTVTDGPFAETKEQLGGFYLIRADNLDQALELAGAIPIGLGSIELRPVAFRPDAS